MHILFSNTGPLNCWVPCGGKLSVYMAVQLNSEYTTLLVLVACTLFTTNYKLGVGISMYSTHQLWSLLKIPFLVGTFLGNLILAVAIHTSNFNLADPGEFPFSCSWEAWIFISTADWVIFFFQKSFVVYEKLHTGGLAQQFFSDVNFPVQCVWTAWIRENRSERSLKASKKGSAVIIISNVIV